MGNRYRKPPSDLVLLTLQIQDRIGTLESTPRSSNTSVDTGHFRFKASNGVVMVDFGDQGPGLGRGYVFRRGEGGQPAFYLGNNQATESQYWALADNSANIIMSDDAQSGQGIARPYIPLPVTKASELTTQVVTTSSTSFVDAYVIRTFKQHPRVAVEFAVNTPAGVTSEVRLSDATSGAASVIAGPITFGAGNGFGGLTAAIAGAHMSEIEVQIEFRVASGAGTIGIVVTRAHGIQS